MYLLQLERLIISKQIYNVMVGRDNALRKTIQGKGNER